MSVPLPVTERDCPKCGHTQAYGPEYRRGIKDDATLGEHLRYYCHHCRFMTVEPTKDQDTPARRVELAEAFSARQREWANRAGDRSFAPHSSARDRDIESVRRSESRGGRPSYGWARD